ncbi:ABC transporter ATP-binding protein [Magnetospirillum moscoviense]|uniref:Multidrug ABC transporter ATP-binding protein n=1 Tax=Magnetospirillum moscoviense TaxID=1437059 RepID=A0A178M796_9PROT|nr:ABC transporter ATP-binding protein [Magnetospirillum moscoviense]MBF0324212.1 ABC transporter ATP-binding protein [Alphaproteobacteria bacterium]OAN43764.1 multidrug ABC transporter ATP-binding protein [Magnetospirillum moscoviense]
MIRIDQLRHVYPAGRKQPERTALFDLTLDVPEGQFTILSGPNGSGKSTLFRILCGLATPSRGTVTIGGFDLGLQGAEVRRIMGVVFQSPAVDKHLTVAENIRIHADLYGIGGPEFQARKDDALAWTDLKDRQADKVETLSGGLARQVELAKVMMTRPKVLLLDEPTTGLDPGSRRAFLDALHRLQKERGMTVLMTSHVFAEAENVDRVAIMREGRLLAYDSPAALRALIGTEMVVVRAKDPDYLGDELRAHLGLAIRRHGDELRLEETENGEGLPLLERILDRWRGDILSISIKQPDLEDVFVHVTGRAMPEQADHPGEPR